MHIKVKEALFAHLSEFLTEKRQALFDHVVAYRTYYLTIALENIYQPHNASAVLRTCDLTGIQDVHIIENENSYKVNPDVALGSSKWLNLYRYHEKETNTSEAILSLKKQGYKIVATTPYKNENTINNIPLDQKTALLFGTELKGLTDEAIDLADDHVIIPMYGFTESYNISVAAALTLYTLTERLRNSEYKWKLTAEEQLDLKIEWARRTIKKSEVIENQFLKNYADSK